MYADQIPTIAKNVLCLGARAGGEVEAFINAGYFALGVDVNPGKSNRHVLYGDFHNLQFADNSVDIVYTNSLDHVLDIDKVISEVARILQCGGMFMTENKGGTQEPGFKGSKSDGYDCFEWLTLQHRYRGGGYTPWGIMYKKVDTKDNL